MNTAVGVRNGIPAAELAGVTWTKSHHSNPERHCLLAARLPGGLIALANSRDPTGPALIITRSQFTDLLAGARAGNLDHLVQPS